MISGYAGKTYGMMEGIDESFDAVFLVAYHAMEGTTAAIMNHIWSPHLVRNIRLNNVNVGELGLSALIAGHYDIPISLVTGDDKVAKEAINLLGKVETAIVKYGISRYTARCLQPIKTAEIIEQYTKLSPCIIASPQFLYPIPIKVSIPVVLGRLAGFQ